MLSSKECNEMHLVFLARARQEQNGCIKCGRQIETSFYQKKNKEYLCKCLFNVSPMAGTLMNRTRIPLGTWFALITDIIESDDVVTLSFVQKKYQLSYTSSLELMRKIKNWLNLVEVTERGQALSKFERIYFGLKQEFALKYKADIPAEEMKQKMLESLPPLFEHLRETKAVA